MSEVAEKILNEALHLSPIDRAELIEKLFARFDSPSQKNNHELWVNEVEERIDAYESGKIETIPAKKVFEKFSR